MEEEIYCKQLKTIYVEDNGLLSGPLFSDVELYDGYHITIEQCGARTITVSNSKEVKAQELYLILSRVVRLLMLFDGKFYTLKEMKFLESKKDSHRLDGYTTNLFNARLSYFESHSACGAKDSLCSFEEVFTPELYDKWVKLLEDLDISHQVYLYSMSANKTPVDLKVAFLVELAEPLVELVKNKTGEFKSLSPGKRGTSLKNCLDALITKYGHEIFEKEIKVDRDSFLQILVNSRVRIMHIKNQQKGKHLDGNESVLYMLKISFLYRHILLSLLGIDGTEMTKQIKQSMNSLNNWNNVLGRLLIKMRE